MNQWGHLLGRGTCNSQSYLQVDQGAEPLNAADGVVVEVEAAQVQQRFQVLDPSQ